MSELKSDLFFFNATNYGSFSINYESPIVLKEKGIVISLLNLIPSNFLALKISPTSFSLNEISYAFFSGIYLENKVNFLLLFNLLLYLISLVISVKCQLQLEIKLKKFK